ncbi:MAG: hypothetical protein ACI4JS_05035 [Oscillospiraceae bacterium]
MDEIAETKKHVKLQNWQTMYSEYQATSRQKRFADGAKRKLEHKDVYYRLRKLQEAAIKLEQHEIVPVRECVEETNMPTSNTGVIRINGCWISTELLLNISPKLLMALLKGLSSS